MSPEFCSFLNYRYIYLISNRHMEQLQKGQFFGQTHTTTSLDGLTLTDTVYTHSKVDWHYHEHAYFTFILQGQVLEGNKKEIYHCAPGSLLFHHWQDAHYNIKPEGFTRGFHLEIEKPWFERMGFGTENLEGSLKISDPGIKLLMYQIFRATKMGDASEVISVESLLAELLSKLQSKQQKASRSKPLWVTLIDEILRERFAENLTLEALSELVQIHPVHLSRDFSRYFHCNLGQYIRQLKVEKALSLMAQPQMTFTEIAYECGFADQSHFTRCFKELNDLNPTAHRKLLFGRKR